MRKIDKQNPTIRPVGQSSDFHDSSLIRFEYNPINDWALAVLSTPNKADQQEIRNVWMKGILEVRLQSMGSGETIAPSTPPEIYDIYDDMKSICAQRWSERLVVLGLRNPSLHCIVFASSFLRSWADDDALEGMRIVCREFEIEPSDDPSRLGFIRPRIPGRSDEGGNQ